LTTSEAKQDLVATLEIQGKRYDIVDSGADICLVQPYVGDRQIKNTRHMVRGVTGDRLEAMGSREIEVWLGSQFYCHNFVVAPFPIKRDGIIGLDFLRAMRARINLETDQLEVGNDRIPLRKTRSA
jgi:hypothetical protein